MAKKKNDLVAMEETSLSTGDFPSLNAMLLKNDKKGLFKHSAISLGFPTGFLPLDYRNGYITKVFDSDDNVVQTYNNIGIFGGTFNTVIGKTGTAKTTLSAQLAANISRYCRMKFGIPAEIYHFDAEQASNYTRIKTITNMSITDLKSVYHLNQECTYIEDIQDAMEEIALMKEANKNIFRVNSGLLDEFGDPIWIYIPTILIIDSLPSITIKGKNLKNRKTEDETAIIQDIAGQKDDMQANRIAKAISRFYKQMLPMVKRYNFIVFVINHINKKIETGAMPTAPQTMYLKMDEAIPCGFAPLYYAHNIFKIVVDEKFFVEKGFPVDGFRARVEFLKSRSNKAGKSCNLIYDQANGFNPYLSLYDYLEKDMDLIGGRNPYRFIKGFEDTKFDARDFETAVKENPELKNALYSVSSVALEKILSDTKFNSMEPNPADIELIMRRLNESQEGEKFDDE